jgi:hypothetical protein
MPEYREVKAAAFLIERFIEICNEHCVNLTLACIWGDSAMSDIDGGLDDGYVHLISEYSLTCRKASSQTYPLWPGVSLVNCLGPSLAGSQIRLNDVISTPRTIILDMVNLWVEVSL